MKILDSLGTALRASIRVKLPKLAKANNIDSICKDLELQALQVTESTTVFDITNKIIIGKTEFEIINSMCHGIKSLLDAEFKLN